MEKGRKNRKRRKNDPSFHFLFKGKQLKKEGVSLTLNLNESANQTHSDSVIGIFKDWRVLIGKGKTIHILKGKSNGDAFFCQIGHGPATTKRQLNFTFGLRHTRGIQRVGHHHHSHHRHCQKGTLQKRKISRS